MMLAAGASCTGECQKSGPLGLATILLLCVACYFLFKSMSKHMRRVREGFPVKDAASSGEDLAVPTDEAKDGAGAQDGVDVRADVTDVTHATEPRGALPVATDASDDQAGRTAGSTGP